MAKALEAGGVEISREPPGQPKVATAAACLPACLDGDFPFAHPIVAIPEVRKKTKRTRTAARAALGLQYSTVQYSKQRAHNSTRPVSLSLPPAVARKRVTPALTVPCCCRLHVVRPPPPRVKITLQRQRRQRPIPSHPLYCAPSPRTPCFLHSAAPGWIYARHRVFTTTTTTTTDNYHYHSRVSPRPSTITTANAGIEAFDPIAGQPPSPSLHADARDHVDLRARYTRMTSISAYRRQHQ
ncbi:uncharacterized protein K489DRAFT_225317 [Dissoconium aciculare CBS 342.82]|uniref:Uncharacterized protein n=1 Tax=Dissoconium aciculare CBS 342.82 TaxID=1314786 RepID=A0A6J3M6J3_9PEZI|nr:uncharacterized protein K489DRAFT_225317 [Dissoconium aciculare CBS 342.82]KAF1823134.1 hypothetical protein K489DRAFT_225317 [Dissoconium aciculare CBS 342.82]